MTSHEPILWSDDYLVGVERIDAQHKVLVNTLNEANARLAINVTRELLEQITRDLLSYAIYHFETEESLMREYDYAGQSSADAEQHRQEHRSFSQQVVALRNGLRDGNLVSREELLSFLNGWLLDHILHTDKRLGAFLNSRGYSG
ncbi:MAG: bacteriohemerythrin [Pseudomonadota bacterium]|nr:bacteriohemerythrin [Pseudomonadota bacterium]MDP1903204.1 bacteriohemerythrin [Pseudomonadota bacterium]MDP2354421.1 bacteriohemerythrin [Pseudomonadota bacterium]